MVVHSIDQLNTEDSSNHPSKDQWEIGYVSRRMAHKKPRLTFMWVIAYLLSPLAPSPKVVEYFHANAVKAPRQREYLGRSSSVRRGRRLRKLRWLRFVRGMRRAVYMTVFLMIVVTVSFWAKCAVVYDVPAYMQVGQLTHAQAYVVYKPWWFGPPLFNLAKYPVLNPMNPEQSLAMQLQQYSEIVDNPTILYVVVPKNG
ncbi:MAG: hypothetical protein OWR52_10995 [Acidibacillus sp.]|uniref:Uncharacterized protein n=1 Tax=Sulfoacidibacillus ferrooxidans TaxID=2005001 RepID=A0A9X1V9Q5_9BACL|nr:hypothetical protein [Sulfoacidibacillus ferrooxidans]MCI0183305.1 hypothetical protein [Sulfoacidibacillus ferrooxidans]MCY0894016.1 hypothetical protein [Acidibacillus sp.]